MKQHSRLMLLILTCGLAISVCQAQTTTAASELEAGTLDYKQARYEHAIRHFQGAVALDPKLSQAHLYLATAYAQQFIPGVEEPGNLNVGSNAIREYRQVLELDSSCLKAVKGIAYLFLQMKKFEEAKEYYRKGIEMNRDDAELYYSVGVIDWTESYQARMEIRAKLELDPDDSLIRFLECPELRLASEDRVKEGFEMLAKALNLRPDDDDAMAYMNLLYRERADIQCGDQEAYEKDVRMADKWVDLTMMTKTGKAARSQPRESAQGENK